MLPALVIQFEMLIRTFALFFLVSGSLALQGYKILEIHPRTSGDLKVFESLLDEYDFLKISRVEPSDVLVSPWQYVKLLETLSKTNISHKIINENVFSDVLKDQFENDLFCVSARITDCYRSHTEINKYLDDLQSYYPHRVYVKQVGYSYERRALKSITITNGDSRKGKPVIFVDAGIHGREWLTPATGLYVIQQLVENFEENSDLLRDYDWIIMPMINPDGYEFTRSNVSNWFFRKNRKPYTKECVGVDLNRNFDYMYGVSGTSPNPCSEIFKGSGPFSENESTVLRDVLLSLKGRTRFYLSLQSYGQQLLYPWSYAKVDAPNDEELSDVARSGAEAIKGEGRTRYRYGNAAKVTTYAAAGGSTDYAYAVAGARIAVTMELTAGGTTGLNPPVEHMKEYVEEAWIGIKAMARKVIENY